VTQLNGLPKIDPTGLFDTLVAHPRVLPYLDAFVGDPQLVNTWSLSKSQGTSPNRKGGWHGGLEPRGYAVDTRGQIRTQMLNVVWSLTDNGPGDGEMAVLPGSHVRRRIRTGTDFVATSSSTIIRTSMFDYDCGSDCRCRRATFPSITKQRCSPPRCLAVSPCIPKRGMCC
jgi:hypothetical protein